MAQCAGTTKSGNQCKLDAQPGSEFCHLHGAAQDQADPQAEGAAEGEFQLEDLMPILMVGAVMAGMFLVAKTFGKWLPR
jgi:hypothetical protein